MHKYITMAIVVMALSGFCLVPVPGMAADQGKKDTVGITEQQARDAATRLNYIGTREAEIVAEIGRLESEKSQLTRIILAYQSQEAKKEKESKKEDKKQ